MNQRDTAAPTLISIVVPVYNDAENIPLMVAEVTRVFASANEGREKPYQLELIFVNDGSRDHSWKKIEQAAREHAFVRGVCFSRNFGHMPALEAGLREARGDAVVTIDSDLEDPPSLIPRMIALWEEGNEVVRAKRVYRKERGFLKRFTSDAFYWLFNRVSDIKLESGVADFRLIDRQVVDALQNLQERDLFFRGFVEWLGFQTATLSYEKGERSNGASTYSVRRMCALAWSGISTFSTFPIRVVVFLGLSITTISGLLIIAMALLRWVFAVVLYSDIAFLVVFIIFSNGLTLAAIGIVALYLLKVYREVQQRPNYVIWKKINSRD